MKVIVKKTTMTEMPKNCVDCSEQMCRLPISARDDAQVLKAYQTKRHKECPLRSIEMAHGVS